jgi:hypothetical protein
MDLRLASLLSTVELDYQLLLDGRIYLVAARRVQHPTREIVVVGL